MAFVCSICTVKLDQSPAENAGPSSTSDLNNISAISCGHIFHTFCIKKWLSGNMPSNKLCPCCRKTVPEQKCLLLFPTAVDNALQNSSTEPCNPEIADLEGQVGSLERMLKGKIRQNKRLSEIVSSAMGRVRCEKMACHNFMRIANNNEKLAHKMEERAKVAEAKLNIYKKELQMVNDRSCAIRRGYGNLWTKNKKLRSELKKKNQDYQELKTLFDKFNSGLSQAENSATPSSTNGCIEEASADLIMPVSPMTLENETS